MAAIETVNWNWTEETVFQFIALRAQYEHMFTGRKGSAAAAYGKICTEIGIPNVAAAKKKWENLVDKYKKCKYPKTGLGTEGGDKGPLTWKFYEAMDEVLGRKHIISPPLIVDSGVQGSTSCPTVTPPQPTPTPSEVDDVQELCTASTPTWRERAVRKRKRSEEDDPLHQLLVRSERRHEERMEQLLQLRKESNDILKSYLSHIINK